LNHETCDLCNRADSKVRVLGNGVVGKAHTDCLKIGVKAIELYFEHLVSHPLGMAELAKRIVEAKDRLVKAKKDA